MLAIKWRGWTARLSVKICCVILCVVMAFGFLIGCVRLAQSTVSAADEGILFTDFSDNSYFFDQSAVHALSQTQTLLNYQSEENIRNMGCLEWEPVDRYYSDDGDEKQWLRLVSKNLVNYWQEWGHVRADDLESPEARRLLDGAIQSQISEYLAVRDWLDTVGGLYYYIEDGGRVLSNAPEQNADFFRAQPVYIIADGRSWEQSRVEAGSTRHWGYWDNSSDRIAYIAYTKEAVDYQNSVWKVVQQQLIASFTLIGSAALAALAAFIALLCGAGRRYADASRSVHFIWLDKPWLDFGFGALITYESLLCLWVFTSMEMAWRYDNIRWVVLLCALLAVSFMLPLLGWVLSLAKRFKAGKWWRYTLVYSLISAIWGRCKSFVKSLWVGTALTLRAVLIGFALLVAAILILFLEPTEFGLFICLMVAAVAVYFMLRYARRLHLVEQGAAAASLGSYDTPIAVTDGELGSIAASINSISGGINAAVAERMKSERLKTELITNVSHDIRTPLTSLITYTDLLKTEGLGSARAPEYLDVLIQKSARLKALTDDLFEASKAASGNIEVHLDSLDLSDFVRQVLGELDERVNASGLDFRLSLPEHAQARADGRLLWRVMENLLSNVFKYALKDSRVYVDILPENNAWRLEVKNISENPLNVDPFELTERFKRGDGARSDEGSGLGLSIAQSFVQAQGGQFELSIDGDLFKAIIRLPKAC